MASAALPFEAATIELAGTLLVEASAGTGKTHAITLLVVRLVLEQGLEPSQILVMTFTEAATAELRVRIRRQMHRALEIVSGRAGDLTAADPELVRICEKHATPTGLDRLKRAIAGLDEASITTIHGFCLRVLQEHALRTGARYGAELVKDLEELDEDIVYDFWHAYVADWPSVIELLPENPLERLRVLLRERRRFPEAPLVPDSTELESTDAKAGALLRFETDFLRYASTELDARKERQGIFGFDDLLERVQKALRGEGSDALTAVLRERFRAALVDEFQDTDPVQWEIVERVFVAGAVPLLLIGDPKQAIYGFRGADVFTYLAAAAGARRVTMGVNWRSDPGLVAAVNRFFGAPDAFIFRQIEPTVVVPRPGAKNLFHAPSASGSASVELVLFEREQKSLTKGVAIQRVPRFVAAEIARLLAEGATIDGRPVVAADIAVLTRDNKQCFLVQDALRARGVHSVVVSDKSVWTSEEAVDLENLLRGVLDPGSSSARKVALSTTIIGKSGEWIDDLDRHPELLEEWLERFGRWGALWVERGFLRMFREILRELSVPDRLLSQQGGERRLTNALHLGELLERALQERQLGPAALLEWLREQQRDDSNRGEHTEIRLESDTNAVKILTVHKSKGLEFPIVYCPFLWSSGPWRGPPKPEVFHDEDGKAFLDIDLDKDRRAEHARAAERERIADEIRLAYVALTRAKHRLSLLWGGVNRFGIAAMSFILHPDPAILWNNALTATRLDKLTDAELTTVLEGWADGSDGSVAFRRIPWRHDAPALPRPTGDPKLLVAREIERSIRGFARTESFSGLTRGAHEALMHGAPHDDAVSRDHDETALNDAIAHGDDAPAPVAAEAASIDVTAPNVAVTTPSVAADTPIVLSDFPRGSRAGNFFHEIFEDIDFAAGEPADWLEVVTEKFEKHGFSREFQGASHDLLLGQAMNAVRDSLETTLDGTGLRLADVERERRFNELEFRVPVAPGGSRAELNVRRLAAVFAGHPSAAVPAMYAERVERLRFPSLYGYLKGYIDLVFFHEGRWYVVDYKTNHLGDRLGDYDQARMQRAMADSHYYLQYHLYTLAVDRFLRRVERRYDYESSFGGVFYLFIKGLCPGHKTGIFFEKPPRARLDALSALLDGGAP
ncbi:MAG TPA: UvrD-helicase domain-containing protein [Polyangiaceae bacterium]|nr:UvrD-helicase domain-containing protein [Polyangiaceae bacterium]